MNRKSTLVLALSTLVLMIGASEARAAAPIKLVSLSEIAHSFENAQSAAIAPNGNVYVSDRSHERIQEFTPAGEFVLMFGWDVNRAKVEAKAPQSERNVCVAKETCQNGVEGTAAGQFAVPYSVAIDPTSGDVYVEELTGGNARVDKYTAEGHFVWMVGHEVNESKDGLPQATEAEKNLCTLASGNVCKAGVESPNGSTEPAGFKFQFLKGNLLAVGGPSDTLYVGDEQRVQEFDPEGVWKGELPPSVFASDGCSVSQPSCRITALAVDALGDVYVVDKIDPLAPADRVRVFDPTGALAGSFEVAPSQAGAEIEVGGLALDANGHLAVSAFESGGQERRARGLLYETGAHLGHRITNFKLPLPAGGIAFDDTAGLDSGRLYAAVGTEVLTYEPVPVAELVTGPMTCLPGTPHETDITLACSLTGEVNPEGIGNTEVWFEWGRTQALGEKTPVQPIPTGSSPAKISAEVGVVRPNEAAFYYRLGGYDGNVEPPEEALISEEEPSPTPIVAPVIIDVPTTLFVASSSAVVFGELNPENAQTRYFFEVGSAEALEQCPLGLRKAEEQGKSCPGVSSTSVLESAVYGKIGATAEVRGLQPNQTYRYRLFAESENNAKTERQASPPGPESSFTTTSAPTVQARTGTASSVTATSAIVSGTVNPDGQSATYSFELGVYAGAATQYGIVASGLAGAGTEAVDEALLVTGLQPSIVYAYRIKVASGYGVAIGEPGTFTTSGLPTVLPVPAVLPNLATPLTMAFPATVTPISKCKRGYKRDKHGKCVRIKKRGQKGKGAPRHHK
jgi:hypothetical protein